MVSVLSLLPALSAIAIVLMSIFTIGFFNRIGLHFLGLVDVSNLVYSFGITLGLVLIVGTFVNGDTVRWIRKFAQEEDSLEFLVWFWMRFLLPIYILSCLSGALLPERFAPTFVSSGDIYFLANLLGSLCMFVIVYVRHVREERFESSELAGLVFMVAFTALNGGQMWARDAVYKSNELFDFHLKTPANAEKSLLKDVRIVRSSSSGFIIAINGHVSFIAKDDVRRVDAKTAVKE